MRWPLQVGGLLVDSGTSGQLWEVRHGEEGSPTKLCPDVHQARPDPFNPSRYRPAWHAPRTTCPFQAFKVTFQCDV